MSETSTNAYPVDSTSYTLPDGRTVIGRDAYEAEMVKGVFAEKADRTNAEAAEKALEDARHSTEASSADDWESSSFAEAVSLDLQEAQARATLAVADEIRALTAALTRMNARAER